MFTLLFLLSSAVSAGAIVLLSAHLGSEHARRTIRRRYDL
jgi:hypothetical protein